MCEFTIFPQAVEDEVLLDPLLDITFGSNRKARPSYRLRDGIDPIDQLCFSAKSPEGEFLATLRFWPVLIGGEEALLLGPLAVQPHLQGKGIGKALVAHGVKQAKELGYRICFVVGEQRYYAPYGFVPAHALGFDMPVPVDTDRFQVMTLQGTSFDLLPKGVIEIWNRAPVRKRKAL
ncbi:N-acetyltransferase [Kiloniella laminariae]|uniref:N-acetyltransferase n=1 Tax=Kiloniella laminariae TaxID=454162 RepID=A0ABT4LL57_9PROT|nr:N-acetyltransferase [Kiloniella laminariae]MCZ4281839.1 N-acetyltransferase [Kiloniella laminariae]